jgi:nicotinate-nucleotide--dimethylbenzimidazole phosphoribosyltransferase
METVSTTLQSELRHKIDFKTKPPGSLGMLEGIALRVGKIQQSLTPQLHKPHIVVFAGDHGIAATGLVNPFPQAVTAQMVLNFLAGGAAINVFCRQNHIELKVVDSGVNFSFDYGIGGERFISAKIAPGTKNYLHENAMTEREALFAIEKGKEIVAGIAAKGCNMIGFGEMGIGNTSSAALIMSSILQMPIDKCAGRGTGVNEEQLRIKIETLEKVFIIHKLDSISNDPVQLLAKIGGFEIAMMAGASLEAARQRMVIVVDGFISTASLLIAHQINESVLANCVFGHCSEEAGHRKMLDYLEAEPLLRLGLRLGEGTGAALAMPLIQSAVNFLNEMASFESAGVSSAL